MRFRQIAAALLACMVLGGLSANAAQAGQWTIGTEENQSVAGTKLTGPETVHVEKHPGTEIIMSTVLLGVPISISAENVHCWASTTCSISTTEEGFVRGEGKLEFTEVKVVSFPKCTVPKNKIVTELLTQEGKMDPTAGSTGIFDVFWSASGNVGFTRFEGAECPFAETELVIRGTVCGEVVHTITPGTYTPVQTGTLFKVQTLRFGKAQQTTGNCPPLGVGNKEAQFNGIIDNELAGTLVGTNKSKPFGAD